jgi:Skp family chaperone for outer membrane proteins
MRAFTALLAGLVAGAAGLAGGRVLAALEDGKPAAGGCAIAVVDVGKVFMEIPAAKKVVQGLQADSDALKASLAAREGDVNKEIQDVEVRWTPGTTEYEQARKNLALKKAEIDWDRRAGGERLERKQVMEMARVYKEICAEAERIAAERGYACVLGYDPDPIQVEDKGQVLGRNELKLQMALRSVVWARKDVDLTADVVAALSKDGK